MTTKLIIHKDIKGKHIGSEEYNQMLNRFLHDILPKMKLKTDVEEDTLLTTEQIVELSDKKEKNYE